MLDNQQPIDIDEITQVIRTADVMLVRFATFDKRLLIDARYDAEEGPMVRVVPRAGSAAERFRHLKQLRPRFPLPKNIVSFNWPRYVNSMERLGVWQAIQDRCERAGFDGARDECGRALVELRAEEERQIVNAITGEGFETVWDRSYKRRR